jgi:peptidoglycan/LPS O-acetylase OafA/YrhL
MQEQANINHPAHGEYYPHIDGIRALAVLPVVLFHILTMLCPGGFAGVDVFFVISGYLITGGILRDLAKDRFTIRSFYYRRIRRIMPAYFAMIIGVFAVGCALYYATPLIFLSDAVTAGTLFFANIHFWDMAGDYFAPQLHSQALLHLWSLSVEEQFYFFIPLLCAIIWKIRRKLVAPVLTLLAVFSLFGAIYAVMTGKQSYAFYLLPFRAWELLAGSLLAMIPAVIRSEPSATKQKTDKWHALFAAVGLLMVLIPYAVMSSTTPFPGAAAVAPVLGTALLIRYGQIGWVSRLLSCHPFVAIGKISYSLYLWHWPVTVFWRYATYDQLYIYDYIGMFLLSFLLGYLSWRFVELPVRTSPCWTLRRSFAFAAAGTIALVTLSTACSYYKGWPAILHPQANEWAGEPAPVLGVRIQSFLRRVDSATGARFNFFHKNVLRREASVLAGGGDGNSVMGGLGQPRVFLMGDSHAGSLRYGLDVILRKKNLAGYAAVHSSKSMFNMKLTESRAALNKLDELPQVSTVLLSELWLRYHESALGPNNAESMEIQLEEFAAHIKSKGKTLWIVADVPNYKYPLNEIAARMQIIRPRKIEPEWASLMQSEGEYNRMQQGVNARLEEICKKTGARIIPLHLAFKEGGSYVYFDKDEDGKPLPLYRDVGHLSPAGSIRAAQFILHYLSSETGLKN